MKNRARAVAATALALVMAAPQATAFPHNDPLPREASRIPLLLAQAECPVDDPDCRPEEEENGPAEEDLPADEPVDEAEPAPEEPPVDQEAPPPVDEGEEVPVPEEAPSDAEPSPATEEAVPEAEEVEPAPEEVPTPEAPPAETAPAEESEPAPEEVPTPEAPPAETAPAEEVEPTPEEVPAPEAPPAETAPAEETEPAPEEVPTPEAPPAETPPAQESEPLPEEPAIEDEAATPAGEPAPELVAPILDSEKEEATGAEMPAEAVEEPADAGPPPATDEEAQQFDEPVDVLSAREEEGRRVERVEERRSRREGERVLREIGDRIVIQLNNQIIVQSDDRGRIGRDADEVYYEELARGRVRETVVRPNGVQVVTVYDRYGDVVSRSRIMPDGREHVLVYADRRDREERRGWRDPGLDLPPLRLTIPARDYILDAGRVREPDTYYDFFRQPPVEPVRRLYTIDEVRYSARVRDSVRRIELDTITFDFGSASIPESEIWRLEGMATAIHRMLDDNPAETFLIEGHTDAVGSDEANLALSDRRAEAMAMALTNVFDIPPENLVTQGYGKRYLKIDTQEPERQNRRVVMRRITPLVAPVAGLR